jgi:hypothetical protein
MLVEHFGLILPVLLVVVFNSLARDICLSMRSVLYACRWRISFPGTIDGFGLVPRKWRLVRA